MPGWGGAAVFLCAGPVTASPAPSDDLRAFMPSSPSLTDRARVAFKGVLDTAAGALVRLGVHPNAVTLFGLALNAVGALALALGYIQLGGVIMLLGVPLDAVDGSMARLMGKPTRFGAFVDSVSDRWSELFLFFGLLYFYISQIGRDPWASLNALVVFAAMAGSLMVSYTKSRAESLGFDCNVGVLTRFERYLVLIPGLLFNLPWLALWLVAALGNFTAIQRAWHVAAQALKQDD